MVYDPSREIFNINKKIDDLNKKIQDLFRQGKEGEAKDISKKVESLQKERSRHETNLRRFQGPV